MKKGMTLIEVLLSLAIFTIIVIASITLFSVYINFKSNTSNYKKSDIALQKEISNNINEQKSEERNLQLNCIPNCGTFDLKVNVNTYEKNDVDYKIIQIPKE